MIPRILLHFMLLRWWLRGFNWIYFYIQFSNKLSYHMQSFACALYKTLASNFRRNSNERNWNFTNHKSCDCKFYEHSCNLCKQTLIRGSIFIFTTFLRSTMTCKILSVDTEHREYVSWHKSIIKAYNFRKLNLSSKNFRGNSAHWCKGFYFSDLKTKGRKVKSSVSCFSLNLCQVCYSKNPFVSAELNISAVLTLKQSNFVWF